MMDPKISPSLPDQLPPPPAEGGEETPASSSPAISTEELAGIGLNRVVYIRAMRASEVVRHLPAPLDIPEDTELFVIHAANGMPIGIVGTLAEALVGAGQHNLEVLSLH